MAGMRIPKHICLPAVVLVLAGCGRELPDDLKGATYRGVVNCSVPGATRPALKTVQFHADQPIVYIDGNAFRCRVSGREVIILVPGKLDLFFIVTFDDDEYRTLHYIAGLLDAPYREEGHLQRTPF